MLNVNDEQKSLLIKYLSSLELCISNGDIDTLLDQLDDKITEIGFNADYELNAVGLKLQKLYDELYEQN